MKRWLTEYGHKYIETKKFHSNDRVIIKSGLLTDKEATVLKQNGNQLMLRLESLGFTLYLSHSNTILNPIIAEEW